MHFAQLTVTSSQCRTTQEGAMRSRERYQLPHTQLVTRPPDGHRHGVTQPPSSHASPARLRHAQWRRRPPARTAAGSPTRSRRGATCTGTTPGAPWASTRSSGAAGPGATASARRATETLPPAAPAASPRSPAAAAAAPDGTCSRVRDAREGHRSPRRRRVCNQEAEAPEWNWIPRCFRVVGGTPWGSGVGGD
jgi:hypothetical protein